MLAILGLYLVVIERGLRIAASAADDFRSLLAAGLALVIGVQAFIIAAGNLKLIPLTGITLPFISYGGSSLLVNGIVVGLLLALSDKGVEPPPPPAAESAAARPEARRMRPRAIAPPPAGRRAAPGSAAPPPRRAGRVPRSAPLKPVSRSIASVGVALTVSFAILARAPATGRSSSPRTSRPRPTTRRSSRPPGTSSAARSSTATARSSR